MLKSLEISLEPSTSNGEHIASVATPPSTYFHCRKLNDTTFQIVEDDKWREHPFIYAKVYDSVIVLIDTGCGGASKSEIPGMQLRSLRHFIETYPVSVNGNKPLNPGSEKGYVVICTHCHYDHIGNGFCCIDDQLELIRYIGGIEQFKDAPKSVIWASGYDKEFIGDQAVLPIHSLCQFVGMKTPQYKVTHWATDGEPVKYDTVDLGLVIYHTPGHTPDGLAILDTKERVLFVGDFAYEWAPIVFTLEGSVSLYKDSLNKLHNLVRKLNASDEKNGKLKNGKLNHDRSIYCTH